MKSFAVLVLCAVAAFAVTEARQKRSPDVPLSLRTSPRVVVQGMTDEIKLECNRPATKDLLVAILFLLERSDENGTVSNVASKSFTVLEVPGDDNRTSANVYFQQSSKDEKKSSMDVRIKDPVVSDNGKYECKFIYLDTTFQARTISAVAEVSVTEEAPPDYTPTPSGDCECDALWDEIDKIKAAMATGASKAGGEATPVDGACQASFSARFETELGYAIVDGATAMFDYVITNKGEAYDKESSTFTAPCAGQYFFTVTLRSFQSMDSGNVEGVIMVDDEPQAKTSVFIDAPIDNYMTATNGLVLGLKKGQQVKVVIKTTSSGEFIGAESSIFSGFYISP